MRVIAIGARDPSRARTLADGLGVPDAGDYEMVLNHPDVDLVYIPLPSTVQAHWAVQALRAGKHVLCEKPLSANGTTAAQIADAADAAGRRAFVGFHYRLHGFIRRLLEVLASGILGQIQRVEFDYSIPHFVVKPGNIRLDADLGGGSFMDVGCYAVDLIRAAWGQPTVVSAEAVLYADDPRVDMQTDAVLEVADGIPVLVRSSFIGDDQGSMSLRVTGDAASLEATSVIVPQWGAVMRVTAGDRLLIDESAADGGEQLCPSARARGRVTARRVAEPAGCRARSGHDESRRRRLSRVRAAAALTRFSVSPRGCSRARGGTGARHGDPDPRG